MKFYIAVCAALLLWLGRSPAEASPMPDACPSTPGTGDSQRMPGALPVDEGLLDFVDTGNGQRTQLYYSSKSGIAAELVRTRPADAAYPAAYKLYDITRKDLSSIPNWPDGACNASNATTESLGAALAELRDTALGRKVTGPCIVPLVAPDLADPLHSGGNLTWSKNGTACFYANQTAGTVWRVQVQLTNASDATSQLSGVNLELLQLENRTVANATAINATWLVVARRSFNFLSGQKLPQPQPQPLPADTSEVVASLVNPPSFTVCGSAREVSDNTRPPRQPHPGNLTLRLLATSPVAVDPELGREVTVLDDTTANQATVWILAPPPGSPLGKIYGPGRLQVIADQATSTVFVIELTDGNCSVDVNGSHSNMLHRAQLPFNLSDPGWRFTGDGVPFQGRACRRYLLRGSGSAGSSDYEVFFAAAAAAGSPNFTDLVGYKRRLIGAGKSVPSVTVGLVTRIGSVADEPVDYDLAACFAEARRRRLLMRLGVAFDELSKVGSIQLVADTRSLIAKATGLPRLSVAQVSVSKDANAKQAQVWFTLVSWGSAASLGNAVEALQKAVTSGDGLKLNGWRVVKLEEAAAATDPNRGGGGGGDPVIVREGHSGGAMAALGFFMLILGCGAGVVGAWCVWKRRPNMPYYVQD